MIDVSGTIFALATPPGVRGIAVIKISGSESARVLKSIFRSAKDPIKNPRVMVLGDVVDPESGDVMDRALSVYMPSPNSYTGEDVVEIQLHGGLYLAHAVLEVLGRMGLRPARPGEFTLRAFLNGKMDLTQAEAVLDLVNARSKAALEASAKVLKGEIKDRAENLRSMMVEALSEIEAQLDFPEDEIVYDKELVLSLLGRALSEIEGLLETYEAGRILREGATITISGAPNVGKSSLFNRLLGEEKAIVTELPGTTRDVVEGELVVGSIPVKVMDTAGIRDPSDPVEREGVKRAKEKLESSDLVLFIFDLSRAPAPEELDFVSLLSERPLIKVGNKLDLLEGEVPDYIDVAVSAKTGEGIDSLKKAMEEKVFGPGFSFDEVVLTSSRQKMSLERALSPLKRALSMVSEDGELDIAAEEIREAIRHLSELTGDIAPEDILESIFSRFCIGK